MRFFDGLAFTFALTSGLAAGSPTVLPRKDLTLETAKTPEDFQALTIQALKKQEDLDKRSAPLSSKPAKPAKKCTLENASVRRDWEKLSKPERTEYIDAVKCLWALPAVDKKFSAAQNYFDEFVAIHANQTDFIHGTGNFLTWHRYLILLWEETLRNECGFTGHLPYWNWYTYQDDVSKGPMFDGSETSFGSTGEYFAHNGSLVGARTVWLPPGEGGGCIKDGPFVGYTINLGPIRPAMDNYEPWMTNQLDYNPRCQRRDLVSAASARFTLDSLYDLLAGPESVSVGRFQDEFQAFGTLSIHGAGHYTMGGDGSDVYTSLNDPAFYQHHAMVDRVYWMWQALHPKEAKKVEGTNTYRNDPPSANTTVEDELNVGILGPHLQIKDMLDTMAGPLCYIYE